MSTSTVLPTSADTTLRRTFGVVGRPQTYRNLTYLLVGLPLGTLWFSLVVTAVSVGVSMLVVALLGIPILLGTWYLVRSCADVERAVAGVLLDRHIDRPKASPLAGGPWARLRSMSRDRDRWRELGFLVLRFPVGIATATLAAIALTTPVMVALAPLVARTDGTEPFGTWAYSDRMQDVASSPWAWSLVVVGVVLFVGSLHLTNALAESCGRWTERWLGAQTDEREVASAD